jgi:hypothetical protein
MVEIKNDKLTVQVASLGAELQSIKDADGREYLWQAGEKWPRRSPILFPIVCSVNNDTYTVDGKEYHLPRHGFARDTEFKLIAQGEHKVTFALHETEETLKVYPFRFNLAVSYRLSGNKIHVVWHVENTDTREIHFQIGGHPAFLAPGCKEDESLKGVIALQPSAPGSFKCLKSYIGVKVNLRACIVRIVRILPHISAHLIEHKVYRQAVGKSYRHVVGLKNRKKSEKLRPGFRHRLLKLSKNVHSVEHHRKAHRFRQAIGYTTK